MAEQVTGEVDSIFRYILIAARRAEQLMSGARSRVTSRHVKPTTLALSELEAGVIPWQPVSAEEYEFLVQEALVEHEKEDQPAPLLQVPRTLPVLEEAETEEHEEAVEGEIEDELVDPEFDEGALEDVVEGTLGEDLLVETTSEE